MPICFNIELRDTISLMNSGSYKKRFVAEYWQTKIRYERLKALNTKIEAANFTQHRDNGVDMPLHECPEDLLSDQQSVMGQYLHILEVRAEIEGIDLDGVMLEHLTADGVSDIPSSSEIIENIPKENGVSEMKKVY
jgi:hypothetical protein